MFCFWRGRPQLANSYPWENSCFVHQRTGMGRRNSVLTLGCQCGYGQHLTRVIHCLTYSISYSQLGNYTSLNIISKWGGGVLCRDLTGWTTCNRKLCTLIATVKHRTNILSSNTTLWLSATAVLFSLAVSKHPFITRLPLCYEQWMHGAVCQTVKTTVAFVGQAHDLVINA